MSTTRTELNLDVPQGSSAFMSFVLTDHEGVPVPAASLATLTLTIFASTDTYPIVNSVVAVDILNTGRGTVDSNGLVEITFEPTDATLADPTSVREEHIAQVVWTYNGGAAKGIHELSFTVVNLEKQ